MGVEAGIMGSWSMEAMSDDVEIDDHGESEDEGKSEKTISENESSIHL
jgi:hypothetical protein